MIPATNETPTSPEARARECVKDILQDAEGGESAVILVSRGILDPAARTAIVSDCLSDDLRRYEGLSWCCAFNAYVEALVLALSEGRNHHVIASHAALRRRKLPLVDSCLRCATAALEAGDSAARCAAHPRRVNRAKAGAA